MSRSLLLAALALLAAPVASAQFAVAPYAGYDFGVPNPLGGLAVEVGLPIAAPAQISLRAYGEYVLPAAFIRESDGREFDEEVLQAGVDVLARFGTGSLRPYAGLGVAVTLTELDTMDDDAVEGDQDASGTSVGATVIGGATLGAFGPVSPYVEARGTLGERSSGAVLAGLRLGL